MIDAAPSRAGRSAAEILAQSEPAALFSPSLAAARREYRALAWTWHPDRNPDPAAAAVFAHVGSLFQEACRRLASGRWSAPGLFRCTGPDGSTHVIRVQREHAFELGRLLVGRTALAFRLRPDFADLHAHAARILARLPFADARMRAQMGPCLPAGVAAIADPSASATAEPVLIVDKAPGLVLLADLLAHQGGALDPRHAAWIISRLHEIACWLEHAGLAHNAIALDTVLADPQTHRCALLGGWWYAARIGERLHALPARTADLAPPDVLGARRADGRVDGALIRALGRALLGDPSGMRLARERRVPAPFLDWLRGAPGDSAVGDYALWDRVLEASFGPRRFVKLAVTATDIYR
jgi:hypothetical protein